MSSRGFQRYLAVTGLVLFAALACLPIHVHAAGDRKSPEARARVEERGGLARLVVHFRNLPYRGGNAVTHAAVRAAARTWPLKHRHRNRWAGAWRTAAAVVSLRGRRASIKARRDSSRRLIHFRVRIAGSGPEVPDPVPDPPEPPRPPEPPVPTKPPRPPEDEPTLISAPGLEPRWSSEYSDFTVDCEEPVKFLVMSGDAVSVDGHEPRSGIFEVPVDLLPGQATSIRADGATQTVRCRPEDLPLPSVEGEGEGLYLAAPTLAFGVLPASYAMVLNGDGVPIWWYNDPAGAIMDFKAIDTQTLAWTRAGQYGFVNGPNHFDLRKFDATVAGKVEVAGLDVGTNHHDLQPTPDGGWLVFAYQPRDCPETPSDCEDLTPWGGPAEANVIDAIVQKVDAGNELVWQWSSRDHVAPEESADWISWLGSGTPLPVGTSFDIVHMNSLEPSGDGFVFSARHLNAVYRVGDPAGTGAIDWKLGGTPTPESLSVTGDPLSPEVFGGAHDARILPDGSLTVYDNGSGRNRPPRMVRYSLSDGNADLIESISDPRVPASSCCGSARRLPGGNWIAGWGAVSQVAEYSPDGTPVFRLTWPGEIFSYRATREDRLDPADLRAGMDSQYPR